jgi:hypothetical protein
MGGRPDSVQGHHRRTPSGATGVTSSRQGSATCATREAIRACGY